MADKAAQNKSSITKTGSNRRTILIIGAIIVILIIFGAVGYFIQTKSTQEISEGNGKEGTTTEAKNGQKQTTVNTKEGKITIKEGEAPTNFPSDVTIYKNANVSRSSEAENELSIILESSDSVAEVKKFYEADLKKNEWTSIESNTMEGSSLITAKKGNRQIIIATTVDDETKKTAIAIAIAIPK
jgi:hypothetical protein